MDNNKGRWKPEVIFMGQGDPDELEYADRLMSVALAMGPEYENDAMVIKGWRDDLAYWKAGKLEDKPPKPMSIDEMQDLGNQIIAGGVDPAILSILRDGAERLRVNGDRIEAQRWLHLALLEGVRSKELPLHPTVDIVTLINYSGLMLGYILRSLVEEASSKNVPPVVVAPTSSGAPKDTSTPVSQSTPRKPLRKRVK